MAHNEITEYLLDLSNEKVAEQSQRFFKTAEGEYGYGDIFLGIRVPVLRQAVKKFKEASLETAEKLLHSKYHEIRLFALLLLVDHFSKANSNEQEEIYNLYLRNTQYVNNWDLVDSSAHYIVGPYLLDKDKSILYRLAQSDSLWERRIAIMSTFHFIKNNEFEDAVCVAEDLLDDQEDLIHKAVGWML
ncbi:MAG: DNA alkylation repair protein, partial [Kiritimatiellae bacterium]|nr:DNA alkylation repair protein [Kiritimatiellia bacterium]